MFNKVGANAAGLVAAGRAVDVGAGAGVHAAAWVACGTVGSGAGVAASSVSIIPSMKSKTHKTTYRRVQENTHGGPYY